MKIDRALKILIQIADFESESKGHLLKSEDKATLEQAITKVCSHFKYNRKKVVKSNLS